MQKHVAVATGVTEKTDATLRTSYSRITDVVVLFYLPKIRSKLPIIIKLVQ